MERPILFSTPMVQAILDGRKTQTRRICKPIPVYDYESGFVFIGNFMFDIHDKWDIPMYLKDNARWEAGDVLWCRETWRPTTNSMPIGWPYDYRATAQGDGVPEEGPWKSSIHMPKEACRIKLLVNNVSVERLQDITEEDAKAEGIKILTNDGRVCWALGEKNSAITFMPSADKEWTRDLVFKAHYAELWSKINGRESWELNPWIYKIEFELIK